MSKKKQELSLSDEQKTTLKELVAELKKLGVTSVSWSFSGSGDSGDVDSPEVKPKTEQSSAQDHLDAVDADIHDLLTESGYDWWNNEGGYGTLTINVTTGEVDLDMNINVQASEAYPHKTKL